MAPARPRGRGRRDRRSRRCGMVAPRLGHVRMVPIGLGEPVPPLGYTGWDADGGFADVLAAPAAYVYHLAADADPVTIAPLLCAGIIGFRALSRANLPPGGRLGLYGLARLQRSPRRPDRDRLRCPRLRDDAGAGENRALARELGAGFVGEEASTPPEPLDSAIVFAPAGNLVSRRARSDPERWNGGAGWDRDVRHPVDVLRRVTLPGARPAHGDGEHPG